MTGSLIAFVAIRQLPVVGRPTDPPAPLRKIAIEDARKRIDAPSLAHEGFELVMHSSEVEDFKDTVEVARVHPKEIEHLLLKATGANHVVIPGPGAGAG